MPGRTLTIRPGLIVGPHDPSDRFTYWPVRIARGGDVLAPEGPQAPAQIIDVRDLAEWHVRMVEEGKTGVYNATGPDRVLTMGEVLDACKSVTGGDARIRWASAEFLQENEVAPWMELPLWVPASMGAGFAEIDCSKAFGDGLTFRPIRQTVSDTWDWVNTWPEERPLRAGLDAEKERAVLARMG
jgi:2'-hydroxyisoflavone reductase